MSKRTISLTAALLLMLCIGFWISTAFQAESLVQAARRGDVSGVKRWLASHQDVRDTSGHRQTLIDATMAAETCDDAGDFIHNEATIAAIYQAIVDSRQNPNDEVCRFVFMSAAEGGYITVLRSLISRGIDVDNREGSGRTALVRATEQVQVEAIRLLLESGANPNAQFTDTGRGGRYTPLAFTQALAAQQPQQRPRFAPIVRLLKKHGAR
jgi:ankyrin repeat protein